MSNSDSWTLEEWRDHYDKLARMAEEAYEESGIIRYQKEWYKLSLIVQAFDAYINREHAADIDRKVRQTNINRIIRDGLTKASYTRDEVIKILREVRNL